MYGQQRNANPQCSFRFCFCCSCAFDAVCVCQTSLGLDALLFGICSISYFVGLVDRQRTGNFGSINLLLTIRCVIMFGLAFYHLIKFKTFSQTQILKQKVDLYLKYSNMVLYLHGHRGPHNRYHILPSLQAMGV